MKRPSFIETADVAFPLTLPSSSRLALVSPSAKPMPIDTRATLSLEGLGSSTARLFAEQGICLERPKGLREGRKGAALCCILANILLAHGSRRAVGLYRNREHYSKGRNNGPVWYTYDVIVGAVNRLKQGGYIEQKTGS